MCNGQNFETGRVFGTSSTEALSYTCSTWVAGN